MSAVLSSGPTDLLSAFVLLLVTLCPLAFCMLSLPAIVKHEYRAFLEARIGVSHRRLMGDDGDELRDGDIEQQPRQKAIEAMLLPDIKRPADQPSPTDLLASSPANLLYQARLDELDAAVGKPADVTANRKMAKSGTSSDKPSPDKPSPAALSNLGAVSHDKVRDELVQEQASSSQSTLLGSDSLLGPRMDKYSPRHLSHRAAESQHQAESQRHSQRRAAQEEASQRREAKEAAAREAAAREAAAREAAAREATVSQSVLPESEAMAEEAAEPSERRGVQQPEDVIAELKSNLRDTYTRVLDLFRSLDVDHSGSVDAKELKDRLVALGLIGKAHDDAATTDAKADDLFKLLDRDGSKTVGYDELHAALRRDDSTLPAELRVGAAGPIATSSKNKTELRA